MLPGWARRPSRVVVRHCAVGIQLHVKTQSLRDLRGGAFGRDYRVEAAAHDRQAALLEVGNRRLVLCGRQELLHLRLGEELVVHGRAWRGNLLCEVLQRLDVLKGYPDRHDHQGGRRQRAGLPESGE